MFQISIFDGGVEDVLIDSGSFVKCPLCNNYFKTITNTHLRDVHNLTLEEFNSIYVNWNGISEETRNKAKTKKNSLEWRKRKYGEKEGEIKHLEYIAKLKKSLTGKKRTPEQTKALSDRMRGRIPINKGMTYLEFYGEEKTAEILKKFSSQRKGKTLSDEHKKKIRDTMMSPEIHKKILEVQNTDSIKQFRRELRIKEIKDNGYKFPTYNKKSVEVFKQFDELHNTKGQFATSPHEYDVLGYWLDYINFDLKLIIEIDEDYHFDKHGNLKNRDIKRQEELQRHFSDFEFLRFRDKEMHRVLEIDVSNFKHAK